jgi:hypothetical protein
MIKRRPRKNDVIEAVINYKEFMNNGIPVFRYLGVVTKVKEGVAHIRTEKGSSCFIYECSSFGFNPLHRIAKEGI